jgi:hypothetical protein
MKINMLFIEEIWLSFTRMGFILIYCKICCLSRRRTGFTFARKNSMIGYVCRSRGEGNPLVTLANMLKHVQEKKLTNFKKIKILEKLKMLKGLFER